MRPGHRDELLRRDHESASLWCLMDYFDPIAITDTSGEVQERYSYSAFGMAHFQEADFTPKASAFNWTFLFHGKFRDTETEWDNYGYRYYIPELGCWPSRDPILELGELNVYNMVGNDLINNLDFLGLQNRVACCGGKKYSPGPNTQCCGGEIYSPREHCCHQGKIEKRQYLWEILEYKSALDCAQKLWAKLPLQSSPALVQLSLAAASYKSQSIGAGLLGGGVVNLLQMYTVCTKSICGSDQSF